MKDALQPVPASGNLPEVRPPQPRNPSFDALLNPPEFENVRGRLVRVFARRGCSIPEDLADETIARVVGKLPEIAAHYEGDPLRFVYAVARNVYREFSRRPRTVSLEDQPPLEAASGDDALRGEETHACLESCLSKLDAGDRRLIREYYRYEKSGKIDGRRRLSMDLGIAMNTLRIRAYRIRKRLSLCVLDCAKKSDPEVK
jgi:DNA-directed RNA polymerase specialized sigma24 family protein